MRILRKKSLKRSMKALSLIVILMPTKEKDGIAQDQDLVGVSKLCNLSEVSESLEVTIVHAYYVKLWMKYSIARDRMQQQLVTALCFSPDFDDFPHVGH